MKSGEHSIEFAPGFKGRITILSFVQQKFLHERVLPSPDFTKVESGWNISCVPLNLVFTWGQRSRNEIFDVLAANVINRNRNIKIGWQRKLDGYRMVKRIWKSFEIKCALKRLDDSGMQKL
jgi:hypothetical protein